MLPIPPIKGTKSHSIDYELSASFFKKASPSNLLGVSPWGWTGRDLQLFRWTFVLSVLFVFLFWKMFLFTSYLGGGFKYFLFPSLPGEDFQFD